MLLGNYSVLNKNSGKSTARLHSRYISSTISPWRNQFTPDVEAGRTPFMSLPTGAEPPYSFVLANNGGELSCTTGIVGLGTVTGSLIMGRTMEANLSGVGDLQVAVSLISSVSANLSGVGDVSPSVSLTLTMAASLVGSGDLTAAIGLLVPLNAALSGVGGLTSDLKGNADIAASIFVNQSQASVQDLVDGVWNALASSYNTSGTMGQKLNAAGTAGDPWTTDLSSYTTPGTAGKVLKDKLSTAKFIALK